MVSIPFAKPKTRIYPESKAAVGPRFPPPFPWAGGEAVFPSQSTSPIGTQPQTAVECANFLKTWFTQKSKQVLLHVYRDNSQHADKWATHPNTQYFFPTTNTADGIRLFLQVNPSSCVQPPPPKSSCHCLTPAHPGRREPSMGRLPLPDSRPLECGPRVISCGHKLFAGSQPFPGDLHFCPLL